MEKVEVPSADKLRATRISNWANLIVSTKTDDQADAILADVQHHFADLSKEDLLKRLITTQLDHLMVQDNADLNYSKDVAREKVNRDRDGFIRYFINLGQMDGVTKGDLLHFLSDVSGVPRKAFGQTTVQKNCAFFDVAEGETNGFAEQFKGVEVEGRRIRVNRDDEPTSGRGGRGGYGGHGKFKKGKKLHHKGGRSSYGGGGGGGRGKKSFPRKKRKY